MVLGIILGVIVLIALFFGSTYNSLVKLRNMVKDQWSQIDVLLKRRADLIPNLVETVKGYTKHESETLEAVINARNKAVSAQGAEAEMKANGELSGALSKLFALAESYPDLKANTNFLELQRELTDTEDKIQATRQFYNTVVLTLNSKIEMFPSNIFANLFHFEKAQFFEMDEAEAKAATRAPTVKFD